MKKIAILGSTGSIGAQTLDVVREHSDELQVVALAAGSNKERLKEQIKEFHPKLVSLSDEKKAQELKEELAGEQVEVVCGMEGLIEVAGADSADVVVTAVVGMMGILPTMEAIKKGKDIALANKETLVTAGHLIIPMAKEYGVSILPVDSEHSAIFQSLQGEPKAALDKILLTASGGPFRGKSAEFLETVTLEDALNHPNWSMGHKITIDSSTMVNKGLEVMEAGWLFGVSLDQIQVVIQPASVIHSMIEYEDGAVLAQLGTPDMKLPIQYALYYPERRFLPGDRLDFTKLREITFDVPDPETFKGLRLAYEAGKTGGSMPTVFNAANELAVSLFLKKKIPYLTITDMIQASMEHHKKIDGPDVDQILAAEAETYNFIQSKWNRIISFK